MKLISMTDFVLNFSKESNRCNYEQAYDQISSYANFLNQPLKLEMFVPCDENGNLLEEIIFSEQVYIYLNYQEKQDYVKRCDIYKKAKEKVLFEGIDLDVAKYHCERNVRTVEYFTSFNLELKPNAIKRIFG